MNFLKTRLALFACLSLLAISGSAVSAHGAPLTEGSLVQAQGDAKVYFIENAQKRWIASEQAFLGNGFRWSDIIMVEAHDLQPLPEGVAITGNGTLGRNLEGALLPDLAPVAPYDLRFTVEGGRTLLRFTGTFWNRGKGALELNTNGEVGGEGDREYNASQRVFRTDGGFSDRTVGVLFWHQVHAHYHYDKFGTYTLEMVRPFSGSASAQTVTTKTTFCMRDDMKVVAPSDGAKQAKKYGGCAGGKQGVSIGWADVYPSTLPDQHFDMTGMPAGLYKIVFNVDPYAHFLEMRRDNNVSMTFVELDPAKRTLRIVGNVSPYESPSNRLPDGSMIQAEGDSNIYFVTRNKKRLVRSESVLASYGYLRSSVLVLPKRAIEVIPSETLIRVAGSSEIYALNVAGFKRRILSPDILASYGLTPAMATEINRAEFDTIPFTNLISRIGEDRVYSMDTKAPVGTFASLRALGLDSNSVHGLNEKDFQAYGVSVVADGLNVPWDLAFLPDGDMLVTERSGTVRRIGKNPASFPLGTVLHSGEGGLLGIALHPNFAQNQFVYLDYTSTDDNGRNKVARFRLDGDRLIFDKVIVEHIPAAAFHDGGQIAFGPDGMLYVTTGDAETPAIAQDLSSLGGKTLRYTADGEIPSDNPFGTAVWSYGHRNAQGIAWDGLGRMWQTEHGRSGLLSGYDELNLIEKGANYGWPTIQGDESRVGMQRAKRHSGASTTWAPSGLAYVNGRLFFAGLRGASLYQAVIGEGGTISIFTTHLAGQYGRLRGVTLGPDGYLYVTTSNRDGRGTVKPGDDKILRIHPDFLR